MSYQDLDISKLADYYKNVNKAFLTYLKDFIPEEFAKKYDRAKQESYEV